MWILFFNTFRHHFKIMYEAWILFINLWIEDSEHMFQINKFWGGSFQAIIRFSPESQQVKFDAEISTQWRYNLASEIAINSFRLGQDHIRSYHHPLGSRREDLKKERRKKTRQKNVENDKFSFSWWWCLGAAGHVL